MSIRITVTVETDEADLRVMRAPFIRSGDEREIEILGRELDQAVSDVKRFYGIEDL